MTFDETVMFMDSGSYELATTEVVSLSQVMRTGGTARPVSLCTASFPKNTESSIQSGLRMPAS